MNPIVTVTQAWREASRAHRLASLAAAMQRPDLAAAELMWASKLLTKGAEQMTEAQRQRAMTAFEEIRDQAGNIDSSGPIAADKEQST